MIKDLRRHLEEDTGKWALKANSVRMTMRGFSFCNHGSVSLIYSHNEGKGRIHEAADSKQILRTCLF